MPELADIVVAHGIQPFLVSLAIVLARVVPIVELAPFLGGQATPRSVKTAVALGLTVVVYPAVFSPALLITVPEGPHLALIVVREALIGLTLGFVTALVFEAVRIGGQVIDAARGQTLANALVPQLPERASVTADYLYQLSIALFFIVGGHRLFLSALVATYQTINPLGYEIPRGSLFEVTDLTIRLTADAIALGVALAVPAVFAILLADLVLALVNKSAPQINVFFLGMPLKALLGVAVVMLTLGLFADRFIGRSLEAVEAIELFTQTLGDG